MKLIFFFLTLSAFAFEDLDLGVKKKIILQNPDFSSLDKLINDQKKNPPLNPFELYTPPPEDLPIVKLMIKKGTPAKKGEVWKTVTKDIIAYGKMIKQTKRYQIFDSKNQVAFEIDKEYGINVDDAVDMDAIPKKYIIAEQTERKKPFDKTLDLTHSLSLNKQTIDSTYFSELFNTPQNTADALKLDYKLFHKTSFPIAFGIVGSLEYGDYAGSSYSSLFIGAGIKSPLRISEALLLEGHLIFERSLFLKVHSTDLSEYNFQGNIEAIYKDRYFFNISYSEGTLAANDQWIQATAGSNKVSNFGIGIGIKWNSDIRL